MRVSGGHLCAKHRSTDRGGSRDLEPTVLYFLCGENTAVGSVALTVHWTVIHYHLTLRVFALLATLVALITLDIDRLKFFFVIKNENSHLMVTVFVFGCGGRVRVSGGHLCAKHRSTDRGGSRDLEPIRANFVCLHPQNIVVSGTAVHRYSLF